MGDTFAALARLARPVGCATLALLLGCHSRGSPGATQASPSCRDVAKRGEQVIAQARPPAREETERFYAEVIDLCQEPGLAQRARACLTRAVDLRSARSCPSLPATADTSADAGEADGRPPSCRVVVAHAMRTLAREPDAPVSATDRAEEEQLFMRDCSASTADGRRCALKALTTDAIDECLAMRPDDDDLDDDDSSDDTQDALDPLAPPP